MRPPINLVSDIEWLIYNAKEYIGYHDQQNEILQVAFCLFFGFDFVFFIFLRRAEEPKWNIKKIQIQSVNNSKFPMGKSNISTPFWRKKLENMGCHFGRYIFN